MSAELVFYTHPMSRGRIARWMLEETGETYTTRVVDYGPAMKGPDYLAVNPMGKVPALVHGEVTVTECPAIIAYLADAFPEAGLAPAPGSPERGAYYRWLFFAAGPLEAATINTALGFQIPDDPMKRGMAGYGSMADVLDTLERALAGRAFIVGERFTAADVYLAAHLGWGMMMGTVEKRPAFEAYTAALAARPAAIRAREIDDELLKKHPMPGAPG